MTACLIVRDEQDHLERCLRSIAPFVDEIAVCDTGSRDATVEIARAMADHVIEIAWAHDFAAARNTVADVCRTSWAISIDADEMAGGYPRCLPILLDACGTELDALSLDIANEGDFTGPREHRELRLFRPADVQWVGRIHERLSRRDGGHLRHAELPTATLSLVHDGYADPAVAVAKAARNAAIARDELDELVTSGAPKLDIARSAYDLGRSLATCGQPVAAVTALLMARENTVHDFLDDGHIRRGVEYFLGGPLRDYVPAGAVP